METINANAAILSNYEVLSLLKEKANRDKQKRPSNSIVARTTFETMHYLQNSPCAEQSPEKIKELLTALVPFNLTKAEKLMLINNPPQKEIDVHLIVEDSGERLSDSQIQEVLNITRDQTPEVEPAE